MFSTWKKRTFPRLSICKKSLRRPGLKKKSCNKTSPGPGTLTKEPHERRGSHGHAEKVSGGEKGKNRPFFPLHPGGDSTTSISESCFRKTVRGERRKRTVFFRWPERGKSLRRVCGALLKLESEPLREGGEGKTVFRKTLLAHAIRAKLPNFDPRGRKRTSLSQRR